MIITKKHLARRTFLRGAGVAVALPLLESMVPAQTPLARTAAAPKMRLGFLYMPHGAVMHNWTPIGDESGYELSRTLTPLKNVQQHVTVVSGLAHKNAGGVPGDPGGDHGRSPSIFLCGDRLRRTEGEDVHAGVTADQIAALKIGQETPLPSIELATEDMTGLIGACDVGFSCTYTNTISWKTPTTPLPMEINPRAVFDMLFGDGATVEQRLARIQREKSILDAVANEGRRLNKLVSPADRAKIDEYLENVREIERRIQLAEKKSGEAVDVTAPTGIPDDHQAHSKLMLDLITLAWQSDMTRVASFMMAREVSYRTFPMAGVPEPFHATSHHQDDPAKLEALTKINTYHVGLIAYFLEKLAATPDGDGTLLDHSFTLYGSCMSNSNLHNHSPLPWFVAGGANGQHKGGRHLKHPEDTPASNLLLSMLQKGGVDVKSIGDSTGPLVSL